MQPIIGQNSESLAFPDLRNLGTIVRILLGANLLFAIGAFVQAPGWAAWHDEWMDVAAVAQPYLLLELALLIALAPWLNRASWRTGAGAVLTLTVAIGVLNDAVFDRFVPIRIGSLSRHVALALIVAAALLFYLNLRARALSPAVIEARLQALQARIRPHFLFNSINAVLSLVRVDPRRAETALEDMADLFRVLMSDKRNLVPLADEVELCRQYLALEHLRLGSRLRVDWHLNSMPGDALVPPLVLQPLIENAVYHGIEPLAGPGVVSINIFARDAEVHAILRNPYSPDAGRQHAGNKMALHNVRQRLALHFDVEAALETRVQGDRYEVHIRMPYRTIAAAPAAGLDAAGAAGQNAAAGADRARLAASGREPRGVA
jgi:two-component system sensor histidine kinase AlgZ